MQPDNLNWFWWYKQANFFKTAYLINKTLTHSTRLKSKFANPKHKARTQTKVLFFHNHRRVGGQWLVEASKHLKHTHATDRRTNGGQINATDYVYI